jgi:hypothetical protein
VEQSFLTTRERSALDDIRGRLEDLKAYLNATDCPEIDDSPALWHSHLAAIKEIVGNASNGMSFIACLSAKHYLCQHLSMADYDAASKPQGAPGLDIDERTLDGKRIIGEIKTTTPFKQNDFGAAQIHSFRGDFTKLNEAVADYKFLFVTDVRAYNVLNHKYARLIPGVEIVLLNMKQE